ncbi:MAG: L-2-hydroxyglutarate oxidase [Thermoflexales bacterium]|nr:L-2-hydroxyglutarate oxidase [Thermoflexales bacterium]
MTIHDFAVVGGGLVGLATARGLLTRFPGKSLVLIEKEDRWAFHQSGHNSGVIHSGIYYRPGTLRAKLAGEGNRRMVAFCQEHGIAHDVCGKVIVATEERELPQLDKLFARGQEHGLDVRMIGPEELREREPHGTGLKAIHVPSAGIADYKGVAAKLVELSRAAGGDLRLGVRLKRITHQPDAATLETSQGDLRARFVITCGGLHADRIALQAGAELDARIVPFRGEYFHLSEGKHHLVNHLIYPVPNPDFPFLGVHFTRMIDGERHCGPNAVFTLSREGYTKLDVNVRDALEAMAFPGFQRLAARNWRMGWEEIVRSYSKARFVQTLQRLIPEVRAEDLTPSPAGVRAQALTPQGALVDDFLIVNGPRAMHVCNAPSPAATCSIVIGEEIARRTEALAG